MDNYNGCGKNIVIVVITPKNNKQKIISEFPILLCNNSVKFSIITLKDTIKDWIKKNTS